MINNINTKVKTEKVKSVYNKLSKSTDKMLGISGMNGYSSTEDFVNALKKHYSISKVCKPENIQECWGTKTITLDEKGTKWEISKTTEPKHLKIDSKNFPGYKDIMGIVSNDGVPMIISYDTKCDISIATGRSWTEFQSSSTSCISGIFDYNGGQKPNTLNKDIYRFNASTGIGQVFSVEVGNACMTMPMSITTPMSLAECEAEKASLGIAQCYGNDDYWAAGVKACGGLSNVASEQDLADLATELYGKNVDAKGNITGTKNSEIALKYGLNADIDIIANSADGKTTLPYRSFGSSASSYLNYTRSGKLGYQYRVLCKA